MADERRDPASAPDPRTPLPPGPRDRPGWRVEPAPDGRGAPQKKPPMLPFSPRRFFGILLLLLVLNYLFVAIFAPSPQRPKIPYSPFFLQQVQAGNVKDISAQGESVKGTFKKAVDVPGEGKKTFTRFETEVPTFANTDRLSNLLQQKHVQVNAKPPNDRSLLETLIFSFGPTLLLVGLFVFRAACSAASGARGRAAPRAPTCA